MCGIVGIVDFNKSIHTSIIEKMVDTLSYRGPDDRGIKIYDNEIYHVGLGHRRLSIQDLSLLGHQPMVYKNLCVVFNGEIYNFKDIRQELIRCSHIFLSNSDTEVILHAFDHWGIKCVDKFNGMFAIAIYDQEKHKIFLLRDRCGVKPLYYSCQDGNFAFASELKALMSLPYLKKELDERSLSFYLQCGYIPDSCCIFKNCYKLCSGCYFEYDLIKREKKLVKYWDLSCLYSKEKFSISYDEALSELRALLISSVKYRLISDVPVGVFLSSGFDSAAVAAIITNELNLKPQTFTVGFDGVNNEAPDAKKIANYLEADHTEYYCTEKDALDIIPELSFYFDEPLSDISAIPTILVSKMTRKKVKVALSADGGDECFAGYAYYKKLDELYPCLKKYSNISKFPFNVLYSVAPFLKDLNRSRTWNYLSLFHYFLNSKTQNKKDLLYACFEYEKIVSDFFYEKSKKYDIRDFFDKYVVDNSFFSISNKCEGDSFNYNSYTEYQNNCSDFCCSTDYNLLFDFKTVMRDLVLSKVDRASMSVSLEVRNPLLDYNIVEFSARLPFNFKYQDGVLKRILKDLVYQYIPRELMDRPKKGFSIPLYQWLRGDLKEFTHETFYGNSLVDLGFNGKFLKKMCDDFLKTGNAYYSMFHGYSDFLWRVIVLDQWYKRWCI